MKYQKMYIDGVTVVSPQQIEIVNPATENVITKIYSADKEYAQKALDAAKKAQKPWANTPISERVAWMKKLQQAVIENEELLRQCVHEETGKTWAGTEEDYQSLVDSLGFYSEEIQRHGVTQIPDIAGTHKHTLSTKPVGVVVAYLSWNFPLLNLGFKLGPAMATGCPIILKPSLKSPLSAYALGAICEQIGLPSGVVNIISGDDADIGDYISSSKIPAMLTLIGAISTGIKIMQAGSSTIKRYSMELGGNTPFIVYKDADLDLAADILTALKFGNAGQICVAPNRIFVEAAIEKEFTAKVLERVKNVVVGYGKDSDATMGPLIDKASREKVHALVTNAVQSGAELITGGTFDAKQVGAFYPPTVLRNVIDTMPIYQEEVFGPVISLITFEHEDEVLQRANDTDTGLASYVFTKDHVKANNAANTLEFGEIQINGVKYGIDLPHVGIKQSGIGCDCSKYALNDYLYLTRVTEVI